jgi:hypothetical protein
MVDNTIPTRNQIARLVGDDPAMIKALERLFIVANALTPTEITTLTQLITDNEYATGAADNKADVASSETLAVAKMVSDVSYAAGVADNKAEVAMSIAVAATNGFACRNAANIAGRSSTWHFGQHGVSKLKCGFHHWRHYQWGCYRWFLCRRRGVYYADCFRPSIICRWHSCRSVNYPYR